MPFINISDVYAADPADFFTPKTSFVSADPFAIVIRVHNSSDLVQAGLNFDAVFQLVNPRQDPYVDKWYTITSNNDILDMNTKDALWNNQPFQFTDWAAHMQWARYVDAVNEIRGPDKLKGIFIVRGTIDVIGSSLFAHSEGSYYKVVP